MTEANADHPTSGRRRRHKSPPALHATVALPAPRLADHLDTQNGPSDEEAKRKQSVRDQNRLLLFPLQADSHTSMMRLCESLKWILGKLKRV